MKKIEQLRQKITTTVKDVIIFDMDGTLYQLDGEDNAFRESRLEKQVLQNALQFVMTREGCDYENSNLILQQGIEDAVGLSQFFASKYGISREEYFDQVWNISPQGKVINFEASVQLVKELSEQGKSFLMLLTAASKVWQVQVLNYLGVSDLFDLLITGEDYGIKTEVFQLVSTLIQPERVTSIGDQLNTDILPAMELGMNTVLVTNPSTIREDFYASNKN